MATTTELADDRTKLAVLRTIVALDRTLMAWVRTATSLISFGFTIYKFFQALRETQPASERHLMTPRGVGLVMIALGVAGPPQGLGGNREPDLEWRARLQQHGPLPPAPAFALARHSSGL